MITWIIEWTYDGAFEPLFGLGRGEFEHKFSKKFKCPGGCLSFDLTAWYKTNKSKPETRVVHK